MFPNKANFMSGKSGLEIVCAAQIPATAIRWIWEDWLAQGKVHILAGEASTGKTTMYCEFTSIITRGSNWPDSTPARSGSVIIWNGEDDKSDTLIPRLGAAGANMQKVHFINGTYRNGKRHSFDPATDLNLLKGEISRIGDVLLVIIDPIVLVVAGDSHKNADVRKGLAPLNEIAEQFGCAILGITHNTKSSKSKSPIERISGSLAFTAVARIVMMTAKIKARDQFEGVSKTILLRAKSNLGSDSGGFIYQIETANHFSPNGPIKTSRVIIDQEPILGSAQELLAFAEGNVSEETNSRIDHAVAFLVSTLQNGPRPSKIIEELAFEAGISKSTLKRAKLRMKIISRKQTGVGSASPFFWELPQNQNGIWDMPCQNSAFQNQQKETEFQLRNIETQGIQPPFFSTSPFSSHSQFSSRSPFDSVAPPGSVAPLGSVAPPGSVAPLGSGEHQYSSQFPEAPRPKIRNNTISATNAQIQNSGSNIASECESATHSQSGKMSDIFSIRSSSTPHYSPTVDNALLNMCISECKLRLQATLEKTRLDEDELENELMLTINEVIEDYVSDSQLDEDQDYARCAMYKRLIVAAQI